MNNVIKLIYKTHMLCITRIKNKEERKIIHRSKKNYILNNL